MSTSFGITRMILYVSLNSAAKHWVPMMLPPQPVAAHRKSPGVIYTMFHHPGTRGNVVRVCPTRATNGPTSWLEEHKN